MQKEFEIFENSHKLNTFYHRVSSHHTPHRPLPVLPLRTTLTLLHRLLVFLHRRRKQGLFTTHKQTNKQTKHCSNSHLLAHSIIPIENRKAKAKADAEELLKQFQAANEVTVTLMMRILGGDINQHSVHCTLFRK